MSKNTTTVTSTDVEQALADLTTQIAALAASLTADAPAKVTKPAKGRVKKAKAAKAPEGLGFKAQQLRLREHKAAGVIAKGVTVKDAIAEGLMLADGNLPGASVVTTTPEVETTGTVDRKALKAALKGHKAAGLIPAGTSVKDAISGGLMDETGALVSLTTKAAKKAAKKARKAAKAVVAQPVKAERDPEPEYGTEAWIAWARPTDDGAPRRANGSVTPKSEWARRMELANSGLFDAKQIDKAMAV